jgi:quinone-modifying oxidoreductase subunit QmoC
MIPIQRTIKFEADRFEDFSDEIMSIPGCEKLASCIQCGTCSGICPLSVYMDRTPRQVMALVRSGFKNEVLNSHTIWLCASCYACSVDCPRQIKITDIMYALKQRAIKDGIYPKHFPIPVLAREFAHMAATQGRVTECLLVMKYMMKTNWMAALGMWKQGLGLMRSGRFSLKSEGIKNKEQLKRMMDTVDNSN